MRLELLLLGCGEQIQHDLDPTVRDYLKRNGIVVEFLDSVCDFL